MLVNRERPDVFGHIKRANRNLTKSFPKRTTNMSRLPRSITNTLLINDDHHHHHTPSIADHIHQQIQNPEIKDHNSTDLGYDGWRFGGDCDSDGVEAVGVREEALAFARNISHHPETWLDFPLSEQEDDDDFEMSDTQWNHVAVVERLAPRLAALRIELCPIHMSEIYFWKIYFVLLHPRLNKHDADRLSTPQIVAARSMWMNELQKRTNPKLQAETNTSQSHGSNSMHHDFSTASQSPSASMSFEPTTHYTVTSEKSVTQEVGSTKTALNHMRACSYTIPVEDDYDDDDDWIHENSELNGYVGPDVQFGTDEDISFSDLEADDDYTTPLRSKIL